MVRHLRTRQVTRIQIVNQDSAGQYPINCFTLKKLNPRENYPPPPPPATWSRDMQGEANARRVSSRSKIGSRPSF